jgi:hypothetical protein
LGRRRPWAKAAAITHGWYYGCKLLLAVTPDGLITGFVLAPASTEDRWVGEALWCWRADPTASPWTPADLPPSHRRGGGYVGPTGPLGPRDGVGLPTAAPYLTDGAWHGAVWQEHWHADYGASVITSQSYQGETAHACRQQHRHRRQIVETVNSALEGVFGLHYLGAHSRWGLVARTAAKLVAVNIGIWLNRLFGRPDLALATLFSW